VVEGVDNLGELNDPLQRETGKELRSQRLDAEWAESASTMVLLYATDAQVSTGTLGYDRLATSLYSGSDLVDW
jgi:hypothetical protein